MAALQSFGTAIGAVKRNPILFVIAATFSLLQLPGLVAQSVSPLLGSFVSLGFSGIMIFIMPFFFGGVIGMANEAIGGHTSFETLIREGKSHYVSLLVIYFGLFALNLVFGFIGVFTAAFGGAFILSSGAQPSLATIAVIGVIVLAIVLVYLVVVFFSQFFGHAIVIDDLGAVDGLKRSVSCVRNNLLSVFGYTILVTIGGGVFGIIGGLFSLLTSPTFQNQGASMTGTGAASPATSLPVNVPSIGIVGIVGFAVVLVVFSGIFGGFFAAYSTAFYRSIRPAQMN
ncbi:DUF7847 domain-containing protein [Haloferax profundi]|uniref:DUF7847 domain-containing protein n=1 Tax=Haloferax profundi TaxID=1544718 RepID=A0A0W1S9P3_9EURY|nr:hypothetical protein [Haloferax profundi]KTG22890.1 hypothetical protein AUR66_16765 [Haloferax profundi]